MKKKDLLFEEMDENMFYEKELEEYLNEGIDYNANTIKKANQADLEQLAADSFWEGWQKCKEHISK